MEYKVEIQNKFAAFDLGDEEDGGDGAFERINKIKEEQAKAKKEAAALKAAQAKKAVAVPVEVEAKNEKNATEKSSPAKVNGQRTNNATRPFANRPVQYRQPRTEGGVDAADAKVEGRSTEDRPYRGRGGFRRGRGGYRRGPEDAGKREYERHSGNDKTGVKPHEKREGAGAHNWGTFKDDINEQIGENADPQQESSHDDLSKNGVAKENEVVESVEEKEPEAAQLTLDEYKKLQEQNRMKTKFNVRKANEGAEDPKWGKMVLLKKNTEEEEKDGEEENHEEAVEEKKDVNKVNIKFTFGDNRRGTRGKRGFNYEKRTPNKPYNVVPDVLDEKDFPKL